MTSFGTDGIRNKVGSDIFTPSNMMQFGSTLGKWATLKKCSVLFVACDTRLSSELFYHALITGLLQHPIKIISLGVLPTPVLEYMTGTQENALGIMITASHNLYGDNGIKIVSAEGKLSAHDEATLASFFGNKETIDYESLGTVTHKPDAFAQYKKWLHGRFEGRFLSDITIAVDCAHGALSFYAADLFTSFGAHVIPFGSEPNGKNINESCGALHPEELKKIVTHYKTTIGCAFDGDGDRLTLISPEGKILDGDDTLVLLSEHPAYKNQTTFVGTVMSNQGLVHYFKNRERTMLRTAVGDKNVSYTLKKENLLLGGEPSGHTIIRDFSETSDGLLVALRVLESVIANKNWRLKTFFKFPHVLINLPVTHKHDLHQEPYGALIKQYENQLKSGRVVVRYSGTEPLLRILVEDEDAQQAKHVGNELSSALAAHLG